MRWRENANDPKAPRAQRTPSVNRTGIPARLRSSCLGVLGGLSGLRDLGVQDFPRQGHPRVESWTPKKRPRPARCKPSSVPPRPWGGRFAAVKAIYLDRPLPGGSSPCGESSLPAIVGLNRALIAAWPCTRWGLPCRTARAARGALLPHLFTLTWPGSPRSRAGRAIRPGGMFSVALSRSPPRAAVGSTGPDATQVGVTHHRGSAVLGLSSPFRGRPSSCRPGGLYPGAVPAAGQFRPPNRPPTARPGPWRRAHAITRGDPVGRPVCGGLLGCVLGR